jgi:hypothetical protein
MTAHISNGLLVWKMGELYKHCSMDLAIRALCDVDISKLRNLLAIRTSSCKILLIVIKCY